METIIKQFVHPDNVSKLADRAVKLFTECLNEVSIAIHNIQLVYIVWYFDFFIYLLIIYMDNHVIKYNNLRKKRN